MLNQAQSHFKDLFYNKSRAISLLLAYLWVLSLYLVYFQSTTNYISQNHYVFAALGLCICLIGKMSMASDDGKFIYLLISVSGFATMAVPSLSSHNLLDYMWVLTFPPLVAFSSAPNIVAKILIAYSMAVSLVLLNTKYFVLSINSNESLCLILALITNSSFVLILSYQHKHHIEKLSTYATIDGLTGMLNRNALIHSLEYEKKRSLRDQTSFSLLMIDIDNFKQINDNYGHSFGDAVIRKISESIFAVARGTDHIGRYGGEEFIMALPSTTYTQLPWVAERVRKIVEETHIEFENKQVPVSVSIGASSFAPTRSIQEMIDSADKMLYKAKASGRNCSVIEELIND